MSWQLLEICMFSSDNHAQCTHTHTQIRTDAYDWKNGVCVWDIYRCRLSISTSSCQSFDASLACTSAIQYIPHELFWFSSVSFFACNFMNEKPARHSPRTANAIALRNFNDIFFLFSICYAHFCGWFTMHKSGTRACDGWTKMALHLWNAWWMKIIIGNKQTVDDIFSAIFLSG